MEIAIIIFFGSILFGFGLLFLAIRFWQRRRSNSLRQFSQNYDPSGSILSIYETDNAAASSETSSKSSWSYTTSESSSDSSSYSSCSSSSSSCSSGSSCGSCGGD